MKRSLQLICQDNIKCTKFSFLNLHCHLHLEIRIISCIRCIMYWWRYTREFSAGWLPLCNAPGGILADLVAFQGQHMVLTSSSSFVSKIWHVDIKDICHIGILCSLYMFSLPSHPWYSRPPSSTRVSFLSRFIHWMNPKYDIMRTKNICHIGMTCILNQRNTDIWDTLH